MMDTSIHPKFALSLTLKGDRTKLGILNGALESGSKRGDVQVSFRQVCTRGRSKIWLAVFQVGDPPPNAPHRDSTRRRSGDRASTASSVKMR